MKRIVSFVGSCAGNKSQTKKLSDILAEKIRQRAGAAGEEVSYECITGDQVHIEYCRSCTSCFKYGVCPLDQKDDMAMLKNKFLEADIIFFCTPVYMWEMSGLCKTVIDRTSYWSHRFELAGKAGIFLASTDSSKAPDFEERMTTLLQFTGMAVTDCITMNNYGHPSLYSKDDTDLILDAAADRLWAAAEDPAAFITEQQEDMWRNRNFIALRAKRFHELIQVESWDEVKVYVERGITDCTSFKEYVRGCQNRPVK